MLISMCFFRSKYTCGVAFRSWYACYKGIHVSERNLDLSRPNIICLDQSTPKVLLLDQGISTANILDHSIPMVNGLDQRIHTENCLDHSIPKLNCLDQSTPQPIFRLDHILPAHIV